MSESRVPSLGGGDGSLYYEDTGGAGPPVVLLHGGFVAGDSWRTVRETLEPHHRVIVPDLPGYGRSTRSQRYGIESATEDVSRLLDILAVERADLVGFSMGGFIAQRLAASRGDRVARLVLVSTGAVVRPPQGDAFRARADRIDAVGLREEQRDHIAAAFSDSYRAANPREVRRYADRVLHNDSSAVAASFRDIAAHDLRVELTSVTSPTLVLAGSEDHGFGPKAGRELVELLPDARLEVADGVGHTVHLEAPRWFTSRLGRFLRGGPGVDARGT